MAKIDNKHHLGMYTIWITDAAIAKENNDFNQHDENCWLAVRVSERLNIEAPDWIVRGSKRHEQKMVEISLSKKAAS